MTSRNLSEILLVNNTGVTSASVAKSAYNKLFTWIRKEGKKIVGPTREVYLNDPREVGLEEALTEIYAPIR